MARAYKSNLISLWDKSLSISTISVEPFLFKSYKKGICDWNRARDDSGAHATHAKKSDAVQLNKKVVTE